MPNESHGPAELTEDPVSPGTAFLSVGPQEPAEHLFRRLLGAYLAGAPEFVVRERPSISSGTREVVRTFCRRTRQPEIVSEEGGSIRLHDLSFESPVSLDQRVQRMGRLVLAFHREAVDGWSHLPLGDDGYWERRDDEVDREAWYIQRIATLRLGAQGQASELLGSWTVARSLERIADHAVVLGTTGPRLVALPQGQSPLIPLRQFHAQAMDHLEGALAARNGDRANELLDTGIALAASGEALADRLLPGVGGGVMPPATAATVARILESVGRTIAYAQDISQVALDRSIPVVPLEPHRATRASVSGAQRERFLPAPAR
ncbi:MAG: PhoU domain-containing protein [Thermoplasmata archaeon]